MKIARCKNAGESYMFNCPGCGHIHQVFVKHPSGNKNMEWEFNNNMAKPTFKPSLLVRNPQENRVCHSFITDGKIQFLGDCTHPLAGKTVDMADIPDRWK